MVVWGLISDLGVFGAFGVKGLSDEGIVMLGVSVSVFDLFLGCDEVSSARSEVRVAPNVEGEV